MEKKWMTLWHIKTFDVMFTRFMTNALLSDLIFLMKTPVFSFNTKSPSMEQHPLRRQNRDYTNDNTDVHHRKADKKHTRWHHCFTLDYITKFNQRKITLSLSEQK